MNKVQFRFSSNNGILSKGIRLFTWPSKYSHVDIVVPTSNGRKLLGALTDGVKLRDWDYDKATDFLNAWIEVNDEMRVYEAAKSQIGSPYDFGAIAGLMFHRDWKDTGQWFCSELATWSLLKDGVHILNPGIPYNLITPGMMLSSIALQYNSSGILRGK